MFLLISVFLQIELASIDNNMQTTHEFFSTVFTSVDVNKNTDSVSNTPNRKNVRNRTGSQLTTHRTSKFLYLFFFNL